MEYFALNAGVRLRNSISMKRLEMPEEQPK